MKKSARRASLIIIVILVAIQFWPVSRTNPPVLSDIQVPPNVHDILHTACYNCHSNETQWPWYGYVAPVSWLIASDVHEARGHFNFSEWETIPERKRASIPDRIWEEVEAGEMPPWTYRIMHPEARLSEAQKTALRDWADSALPQ